MERKKNAHLERLRKNTTSKAFGRANKTTYSDNLSQANDNLSQENSMKSRQTKSSNSNPMHEIITHRLNDVSKSPSLDETTEGRLSKLHGRIDPTGIEEDTIELECILNKLAEKLQLFMDEDKYVEKNSLTHTNTPLSTSIICPN